MIERHMTLRRRSSDGSLQDEEAVIVAIYPPHLADPSNPQAGYRCRVLYGESESSPYIGGDAMSALFMAAAAVSSHCFMLSKLGELKMEDGRLYDPLVHGLEASAQAASMANQMFAHFAGQGFSPD